MDYTRHFPDNKPDVASSAPNDEIVVGSVVYLKNGDGPTMVVTAVEANIAKTIWFGEHEGQKNERAPYTATFPCAVLRVIPDPPEDDVCDNCSNLSNKS